MKKTVLASLITASTLLFAGVGAASAQGMNPYQASGLSNGNQGYQAAQGMYHSDPMAGQFGRYQFKEQGKRNIKYHLGVDAHQEIYKERVSKSPFMKEKGKLYGIVAGIDLPVGQKSTVALSAQYTEGKANYTGAVQGGEYGSYTARKLDRKMYSFSGTLKHEFSSLADTTLGLGLDYRYLKDNLNQAGPSGYKRENKTTWAHLVAEKEFKIDKSWSVTPQLKGSYLLKGTQTADIGSGIKFKQDKGYGYEASLGFTKDYGSYAMTIKPYYRYANIKASKVSQGMYEPRNTTQETGLQLLFSF